MLPEYIVAILLEALSGFDQGVMLESPILQSWVNNILVLACWVIFVEAYVDSCLGSLSQFFHLCNYWKYPRVTITKTDGGVTISWSKDVLNLRVHRKLKPICLVITSVVIRCNEHKMYHEFI